MPPFGHMAGWLSFYRPDDCSLLSQNACLRATPSVCVDCAARLLLLATSATLVDPSSFPRTDTVIARATIDRGATKNSEQLVGLLLRDKHLPEVLLNALALSPTKQNSSPQSPPEFHLENHDKNGAEVIEPKFRN